MSNSEIGNGMEIYTLATENYVSGAVALLNSLYDHGFNGRINVGYTNTLSISGKQNGSIRFHELPESEYWIGNRKAEYLLTCPPASKFVFFDADIVLNHSDFLPRLLRWIDIGPVFAIEAILPAADFRRYIWRQRLDNKPDTGSAPAHYYNSGFFAGEWQRDRGIIESWHTHLTTSLTPPASIFEDPDFPMCDQDVLNAVLQDIKPPPMGVSPPDILYTASPINPFLHVGAFSQPALLHCTGRVKPWTITKVPGRPPTLYDRAWYRYVFHGPKSVSIEFKLPKQLEWWFRGTFYGRLIQKFKSMTARFGVR